MALRISYNSPVILSFALLAMLVLALDSTVWRGLAVEYFAVGPSMRWSSPGDWFRLFSHVLGHAHWQHLVGNLGLFLLLGPILEQRYGGRLLLLMLAATALATGLLHMLLGSDWLMGASGEVFMLIVLASMQGVRQGQIPLTFVLVAIIFLGQEVVAAFHDDDISQLAHLAGGGMGALIGLSVRR